MASAYGDGCPIMQHEVGLVKRDDKRKVHKIAAMTTGKARRELLLNIVQLGVCLVSRSMGIHSCLVEPALNVGDGRRVDESLFVASLDAEHGWCVAGKCFYCLVERIRKLLGLYWL